MIVGIINGYYRSGTTIFQRFVELCDPDAIVLCEPTQHEVVFHVMKYGCDNVHPLHGFKVFDGYLRLPKKTLRDFFERWLYFVHDEPNNHGIFTDPDDAIALLEPLHECPRRIVVKSTQLSLVLREVVEEFDCWCVHLTRPIENTVYDHFPDLQSFLTFSRSYDATIPFYGDLVYARIVGKFGVKHDLRKPIERLVFNVYFVNNYVNKIARSVDDITVLDFEKFVANPDETIETLPFEADTEIAERVFDRNRIRPVPDVVKTIVHQIVKRLF